jgi:hypothetical protein
VLKHDRHHLYRFSDQYEIIFIHFPFQNYIKTHNVQPDEVSITAMIHYIHVYHHLCAGTQVTSITVSTNFNVENKREHRIEYQFCEVYKLNVDLLQILYISHTLVKNIYQ